MRPPRGRGGNGGFRGGRDGGRGGRDGGRGGFRGGGRFGGGRGPPRDEGPPAEVVGQLFRTSCPCLYHCSSCFLFMKAYNFFLKMQRFLHLFMHAREMLWQSSQMKRSLILMPQFTFTTRPRLAKSMKFSDPLMNPWVKCLQFPIWSSPCINFLIFVN